MAKIKSFKSSSLNLILLILLVGSLLLSVFIYQKYESNKQFFRDVDEVLSAYNVSTGVTKKLVFKHNTDLYITNSSLDPQSAIKVTSNIIGGSEDVKDATVPYYKKMYFVMQEGGAEGSTDCFIFDEDGKIITRHFLYDTDLSKFFTNPYHCSVKDLGDDGKVILELGGEMGNDKKSYTVSYNIYSKEIKLANY